ncbi:hypothetical protein GCM10023311_06760 [Flaviramulus aquimarinus]|uniref:Na(+)-translocating NADH-quinone reductase subunit F n=1 Tax=Flaviramulus aquimarinus TaxID=1170456 RepID=A0ABP9ET58_9FLAO
MQMSTRLVSALRKLYIAFHNNMLNPECCMQCAVGNILDHTDSWKNLSDYHGALKLNYVGKVHQNLGRKFNGYSPIELLQIEATFLEACGYKLPLHFKNDKPKNPTDKDILFNGLSEVVKLLCKMDHVSNVMDYTKLFEFENEKPRYKIADILA